MSPFKSAKQERYLRANHPAIAKRWAAEYGPAKDSAGRPPKSRTDTTDFKPLSPGPKARHRYSKPAKEQDSMKEGKVKAMPGSRK
jgi:hypothetical protein